MDDEEVVVFGLVQVSGYDPDGIGIACLSQSNRISGFALFVCFNDANGQTPHLGFLYFLTTSCQQDLVKPSALIVLLPAIVMTRWCLQGILGFGWLGMGSEWLIIAVFSW